MAQPTLLGTWGWFLAKNIIGWVLILGSFPLGALIPGPGGIPLFLVGFGLITFPGKRRLTARVLRGKPVTAKSRLYAFTVGLLALVLPALTLLYLIETHRIHLHALREHRLGFAAGYPLVAVLLALLGLRSRGLVNRLIAMIPRIRRRIRPWLRRKGIDLLPPRRRRRYSVAAGKDVAGEDNPEIIEIHERHVTRVRSAWATAKPWARRIVGVVITVGIFWWILKPIVLHWPEVRGRVLHTNWWRVLAASVMFASFLFVFRTLVWRRILAQLGHKLPVAAATRIWSTSELARYLPGVIWQVVGRQYLARPYGVRGSVTGTSQILELCIFLLANLMVAVGCLLFLGLRRFDGAARYWLIVATALVPFMLVLVHPKVFYGIVNRVLARLGKPTLARQRSHELLGMLVWTILGLLWQGLAIYVVVFRLLDLPLAKWWVVTGAYCLAWCAGFLAVWAPGGLGVREAVFIAAMEFALPLAVRAEQLGDLEQKRLFLIFLSVLLRIWATVGELILASVAYAVDWKGAMQGGAGKIETKQVGSSDSRRQPLAVSRS
jgi:uncharacterized membrane protein YbhN (UPF0104 family)